MNARTGTITRRLGAWLEPGGTRFAVWSDRALDIAIDWRDKVSGRSGRCRLEPRADDANVYEGLVRGIGPGLFYAVMVGEQRAVDPYARSLPRGVHGPAQVTAPLEPRLNRKRPIDLQAGEVIYEIHIGTFTPEGTFTAGALRLAELVELGVTVIELMPVASFPGKRGWGYDGVALFAPFAGYGTVHELSQFVDAAHGLGLSVLLDVVYNHLGPDGNYLEVFSEQYFDSGRENAWGRAPALEKPAFRRFILDNAQYWLEEVGFDGLRLDAAHELEPGGEPHILKELARVAKTCSPPATLVAEDDRNDPEALFGHGIDAVWSDDFHHSVHVLLTAERDGYYGAYQGELREIARVIERGHLCGCVQATKRAKGCCCSTPARRSRPSRLPEFRLVDASCF